LSESRQIFLEHSGSREKMIESGYIFSYDELGRRNIKKEMSATYSIDKEFGNTGFVFFRIQFGLRHMVWRLQHAWTNDKLKHSVILRTKHLPANAFFTPRDWWGLPLERKDHMLDMAIYGEKNIIEAIALHFMGAYLNRSNEKDREELRASMTDTENHHEKIVKFLNLILKDAELKIPNRVAIDDFQETIKAKTI